MPPASYLAMPVLGLSVALGCVYAWMDTQRGYLQLAAKQISQKDFNFTQATNALFCISLAMVPIIMVMTPVVDVWGHLLIFVQHIIVKHLIVTANFYEAWQSTTVNSKRWFYFYSVITGAYPAMLIADFIFAEIKMRGGMTDSEFEARGPLIPWYITMFFDLSWFVCLATTSRFLPPAPHIKIKYELVTEEELERMHEKTEKTWKKARILGAIARNKGTMMEQMKVENKTDVEAPHKALIGGGEKDVSLLVGGDAKL